jgi:hypothetical protein
MKSINLDNLRRLKKALQKKKVKRIDDYRIQILRCDAPMSRESHESKVAQNVFSD